MGMCESEALWWKAVLEFRERAVWSNRFARFQRLAPWPRLDALLLEMSGSFPLGCPGEKPRPLSGFDADILHSISGTSVVCVKLSFFCPLSVLLACVSHVLFGFVCLLLHSRLLALLVQRYRFGILCRPTTTPNKTLIFRFVGDVLGTFGGGLGVCCGDVWRWVWDMFGGVLIGCKIVLGKVVRG